MHAGVPTILNVAGLSPLLGEASFERLHSCSCSALFFDLALCLVVSDSDMCALIDRSSRLVEPYNTLSLSRASSTSGTVRLFLVILVFALGV